MIKDLQILNCGNMLKNFSRSLYARYSPENSTQQGMWHCKFQYITATGQSLGVLIQDRMKRRIYFVSFGQTTPVEIQKYQKNKKVYETGKAVTSATDIVQHVNTHVCGHWGLFVLTSLTRKHQSYQDVLNQLNDGYTQADW